MKDDVTCIWNEQAELGEGPLWVAAENTVYWVDILQNKLHKLTLDSGDCRTWTFDTPVTSLALHQDGGFIGTVKEGFARLDLTAGSIDMIVRPEGHQPTHRFNDGKIGPHGRYWAGTMSTREEGRVGTLYRLDPDLTLHTMDEGYVITNGPAFSVDGQTMYHTDSPNRTIYAFDLAADGQLSNKRLFIELGDDEGYPDGMTVDSENCLWVAHYAGGRLTRRSPEGKLLRTVDIPAPNVTSCAFGGPNLDTLYITTAAKGLSDEQKAQFPQAGSLFSFKPGVTGPPAPKFGG